MAVYERWHSLQVRVKACYFPDTATAVHLPSSIGLYCVRCKKFAWIRTKYTGSTHQRASINLSKKFVVQGQFEEGDMCFGSVGATSSQFHAAMTALLMAGQHL